MAISSHLETRIILKYTFFLIWSPSFFTKTIGFSRYKIQVITKHYSFLDMEDSTSLSHSFMTWWPMITFIVDGLVQNEVALPLISNNQWKLLESGGHGHRSLVTSVNKPLTVAIFWAFIMLTCLQKVRRVRFYCRDTKTSSMHGTLLLDRCWGLNPLISAPKDTLLVTGLWQAPDLSKYKLLRSCDASMRGKWYWPDLLLCAHIHM